MALYKEVKGKDGSVIGVHSAELKKGIPKDPENTDWKEYLEWVAAGNTPDSADQGKLNGCKQRYSYNPWQDRTCKHN